MTFAGGSDPTGFNINTSKDNGTDVQNVIANVYPSVFRTHPDLLPRLDTELMDGAELTAEDPRPSPTGSGANAVWSDGTPISADDFVYFWEQQNGTIEDNDVASTAGYQDIGSVIGLRGRQDGHGAVRPAVRRLAGAVLEPPSLPLRAAAAGRLEHRARPPSRADPVGRPLPHRQARPGPEPDPGAQPSLLGAAGPPGPDHHARAPGRRGPGQRHDQRRGRRHLPAAPGGPGPPGAGPPGRRQPGAVRAQLRAPHLQPAPPDPPGPRRPGGDRPGHRPPAAPGAHGGPVQRPRPGARQPHLDGRPAWLRGPLGRVRPR